MLYLAGPMTGYKYFNFPAFDEAAGLLRGLGIECLNPAEVDRSIGVTGENEDGSTGYGDAYHAAMRRDIPLVMRCDGIVRLRGWEASRGARVEATVNEAVGGRVFDVVYDGDDMIGVEEVV